MRIVLIVSALIAASLAAPVFSKLPPPTEDAKAKTAEAAAKTAWTDKVGAYKTCMAQDRTVAAYRKSAKAAGKTVPSPVATPACANPGPYASPVAAATSKPLEASGAHSPPEAAVSPPSAKSSAAEISGGSKK